MFNENKTKFSGPVYFFKSLTSDFTTIHDEPNFTDNYVLIGKSDDIEVELSDSREAQIAGIEKAMFNERIESQHRLDQMAGRLESLRALEHKQ